MKLRFYVLCSTVLNDKKKGVCLLHFIQIKSGFYSMNERCYLSQAPAFFFFFLLGTAKLTLGCSWRRRLLIRIQVKKNNVKHFNEHQREGEVRCCMLKAWHRGLLVC